MPKEKKPEPEGEPDADKEIDKFKKSHLDSEEGKEDELPEEESEEDSEGEEDEDKDTVDYEAELAKERERGDKAEKAAADEAFKKRDLKRKLEKKEEDEGEEDEEAPLTRSDLREIIAEERQIARKELQSSFVDDEVAKLTDNPAEANLIKEIHKNRRFPEGMPLREQLEEAYAIANRKRVLAKTAELKRALGGKRNASPGGQGTHREPPGKTEPKLSSQEALVLKQTGFAWDANKRLYIKPLNNGKKHIYYDPKTKKRFVQ